MRIHTLPLPVHPATVCPVPTVHGSGARLGTGAAVGQETHLVLALTELTV